jgi:hypothetical protein
MPVKARTSVSLPQIKLISLALKRAPLRKDAGMPSELGCNGADNDPDHCLVKTGNWNRLVGPLERDQKTPFWPGYWRGRSLSV